MGSRDVTEINSLKVVVPRCIVLADLLLILCYFTVNYFSLHHAAQCYPPIILGALRKKGPIAYTQYGLYSLSHFFGENTTESPSPQLHVLHSGQTNRITNLKYLQKCRAYCELLLYLPPDKFTNYHVNNISSNCEITPLKLPCLACLTSEQQQMHFFLNYWSNCPWYHENILYCRAYHLTWVTNLYNLY